MVNVHQQNWVDYKEIFVGVTGKYLLVFSANSTDIEVPHKIVIAYVTRNERYPA